MINETEHLLHKERDSQDGHLDEVSASVGDSSWPKRRQSHTWFIYNAVVHVLLFATVAYIAVNKFWTPQGSTSNSYSPAASAVEYYDSTENGEDHTHHSIYAGEPTKESVEAWDDLVDPTFLAISEEELIRLGALPDRAVRLAEHEGQFVAGLGVYHQLHCLRMLRFWVFKDHYYSNLTESQIERNTHHLAHCIESLRVTLMCAADTTVYTFQWEDPSEVRPNPKVHIPRQCRRWEPIDQWSRERSVGYYPWLIRPSGNSESVHMR